MTSKRASIDWERVREMLRRSEETLKRALSPDRRQMEVVFRQRAAQLALSRQEQEVETGARIAALSFLLGSERYALELSYLREICPLSACTPVPGAPPEYLGVVNLRGEIRPVVELARLLALPESPETSDAYILLTRDQIWCGGLKVDRITDLVWLSQEQIGAPLDESPDLPVRYLKGINENSLLILNMEELLTHAAFKEESQP